MKKYLVLLVALIAAFMITACSKKEPQDLLIGTWQLTKTELLGSVGGSSASNTILPETDTFIAFDSNGNGRYFSIDYNRNFTYVYNDVISNLIMTYEGGKSSSVIVEVLTENSLVLHSSESATIMGVSISSASQFYYTRVK